MRMLILASVVAVMAPGASLAQAPTAPRPAPAAPAAPVAPAPAVPPRAFQGYFQPDIGASACAKVNAGQTNCTIPAMTAGRYVVEASGTSTATAAGATQRLAIALNGQSCGGLVERKPTAQSPWPVGQSKTLRALCEIEVLTDRPIVVSAIYVDEKATRAPAGPTLVVKRVPWDGILSQRLVAPGDQ
jgi:hypothetical protein